MTREDFLKKTVGWIVDAPSIPPSIRERAWNGSLLDGVYNGGSTKIHDIATLAFLRGVIRGAECVFEATEPVEVRTATEAELSLRERIARTLYQIARNDGNGRNPYAIKWEEDEWRSHHKAYGAADAVMAIFKGLENGKEVKE